MITLTHFSQAATLRRSVLMMSTTRRRPLYPPRSRQVLKQSQQNLTGLVNQQQAGLNDATDKLADNHDTDDFDSALDGIEQKAEADFHAKNHQFFQDLKAQGAKNPDQRAYIIQSAQKYSNLVN